MIYNFTTSPAIVLQGQTKRCLIVRQCYERLDSVLQQLIKDVVIELQPRFVRLRIVAVRENTCPVNGHPEYFETHFSEQRNIFLVAMVEINTVTLRETSLDFTVQNLLNTLGSHLHSMNASTLVLGYQCDHVCGGQAFTVSIKSTFQLVSRSSASPQEIFGKSLFCCTH
ncbi:hypothetical protein D1872_223920 [compost metagenome]